MSRLILIKTCQRFRDRRDACEATWVGALRARHIPIYFVEAGHPRTEIGDHLIKLHGGDAYSDNSYKVRDGLRALLDLTHFASVFICDDDTFVHPERWLTYQPEGEFVGLRFRKKWVCGGGGWFFSRRCAELYCAGINRRFSGDDVIAWEIMRDNGIELIDRPDLFSQDNDRVSRENALITCHHIDPVTMRRIYESIK